MSNLKKIFYYLLFLSITKNACSFAPTRYGLVDRQVTFNPRPSSRPSTSLRCKNKDPLDDVSAQRELIDVGNNDDGKDIECYIPTYDECDEEGGYQSLVSEMAESVDVAREQARLQGLSTYIVVSGLTSAASIDVCFGLLDFSHATWEENIFYFITVISATLCGLTGIYSTVVFSLCVCYGNTAIGLNNDGGYDEFMNNTGPYRERAFRAYVASLCLFLLEIVLISSQQVPEAARYPYLVFIGGVSLYLANDCAEVVEKASPIFNTVKRVE